MRASPPNNWSATASKFLTSERCTRNCGSLKGTGPRLARHLQWTIAILPSVQSPEVLQENLVLELRSQLRMARSDTFFQETDKFTIDIVAAESGISVCGQDPEYAVVKFQDRDIECSAAEVVNGDSRAITESVQAVSQGCGSRLVDDSFDRKSSEFAGSLGGLALQIIKVCRNSNDCPIYRAPEARSASAFSFFRTRLETSSGLSSRSPISKSIRPFWDLTANGKSSFSDSPGRRPIKSFHRNKRPIRTSMLASDLQELRRWDRRFPERRRRRESVAIPRDRQSG